MCDKWLKLKSSSCLEAPTTALAISCQQNKAKHIMKTKEHSQQICDTIIEERRSGVEYKNTSKALNISRSTVRAIIKKRLRIKDLWKEGKTVHSCKAEQRQNAVSRCAKLVHTCPQKLKAVIAAKST